MEPKNTFLTQYEKKIRYIFTLRNGINKKIFIDKFYGPEKVLQTNEKVKHCKNTI